MVNLITYDIKMILNNIQKILIIIWTPLIMQMPTVLILKPHNLKNTNKNNIIIHFEKISKIVYLKNYLF